MIINKKSHFIVSYLPAARPAGGESLFVADPFVFHLMQVNKQTDKYQEVKVADFPRKAPEDLYSDNELLWEKYHKYIPVISEWLNKINNVRLPTDFWRRALSMGLMRHLTMLYDFFKICEANFNPDLHQARILSPDCYYIPVNYDEHRTFFQHSHFGQEQFLSLYLSCFYAGMGREFPDEYKSNYTVNLVTKNWDSDPSVGIMGTLFDKSYFEQLRNLSGGDISPVGFDQNFPVGNKVSDNRYKILMPEIENPDKFDTFFFFSLPTLIPREFIEDFNGIFQSISSQLERYKLLRYVVSEVFIGMSYESIALAILSLSGIRVVYNEHNYSEYPYYPSILNQQVSIADIFAAHGNYSCEELAAVHTGSLFNFVENNTIQNQKIFHAVYISGIGLAKYPNYSGAFGEAAEKALAYLNFKHQFLSSLPGYILKDILYRPYPVESSWDLCYKEEFILGPIYGQLNIDRLKGSAKQRMAQSRLVIIDYISTPHLEALSMNIPTIIIINQENYVLDKKYLSFFEDLIAARILHTDPQKCADFIKQIWEDPESWWSGPEVQNAKNQFLKKNLGKPEDLINFLLKLSQMNRNQSIGDLMNSSLDSFVADINNVHVNKSNNKTFNYSDGEEREDFVYNTLKSVNDLSLYSDELRKSIHDWVSEYHFSQERHNLLRHLKLNANMNILELGCGCGSITRQLGESGANITAIEGSYKRARSAAARCRDLRNVKVYCSNFQDVDFQKKYDVVTLIGVMEYSPLFFNSDDPIRECLDLAFGALKDDGVLIIAIENQLGLKYFAGYHEDHTDIRYFGIEDKYNKKTAITFGRKELTGLLNQTGMQAVEFHYPFPDYKIPKVVFTGKAFNNDSFSPEEILSQLKHRDYSGEVVPAFELGLAIQPLCRNGLMEDLSNSFLVFASKKQENIGRLFDENLIAAFYTTDRVNDYNIKTGFFDSPDGINVKKETLLAQRTGQYNSGILKHELGQVNYIKGKNLESEYRRCVLNKDLDGLAALINLQIKFIMDNAISLKDQHDIALSEIKADYIDCVPSNLIYENGNLHLIDKEWKAKRPVSLGALLMRTIEVICNLDKNVPELKKENLISLFRNMGINLNS
ncbi:MAG: LIC12162 family transferase, partial [Clostridiales bacterium]